MARNHCRLTTADLKRLRVAWRRAQSFVVTADHHPAGLLESSSLKAKLAPARQLRLFDAASSAVSGDL
jgi:predicted DNA-binding helix-hairpin-helix protein